MSTAQRSNPRRIVACPICETAMPLGSRSDHVATEHPGYALRREGFRLDVVNDAGTIVRSLSGPEMGALNRSAADSLRSPASPASPGAVGPSPAPEPESSAPGPTIDESRRPFAWQPAAAPPIVTRQAIADALSEAMLADMIARMSATLSEWDGAGEAGTLSKIEAMQLASLFYDSTLGLIERYFHGSVDRFKLAVGLGILLLGKGRIHLRAIAQRRRARNVEARAEAASRALGDLAAADVPAFETADDAEPEPESDTPPQYPSVAEKVAARQRAWRESQAGA